MSGDGGFPVTLHVYDLSNGLARQMSLPMLGKQIDGIWHTAVVVYGSEYFFGGGIQHSRPSTTPYGRPIQVLPLGTTYIPRDVFEEYLIELGASKYSARSYNLLSNNCNNFSDDVAQFLTGDGIPKHITALPSEVLNTPLGALLAPALNQMETQMRNQGQSTFVNPTTAGSAPTHRPAASAAPSPPPPAAAAAAAAAPATSDAAASGSMRDELQAAFQRKVQAEFAAIMQGGGYSPNEAAAEAIRRAKASR